MGCYQMYGTNYDPMLIDSSTPVSQQGLDPHQRGLRQVLVRFALICIPAPVNIELLQGSDVRTLTFSGGSEALAAA